MTSNTTSGNVCSPPMQSTSNGVFQGDNPLDYALPLAILQICLVLVVTRGLAFLLKPLRQPRVIAEIVGGILLGPSALGRNKSYLHAVFPPKSLTVLDTLANLGLIFFLFLAGIELDPKSLRKTGGRVLAIAIAGISLPFALGIGSSFVLQATIAKGVNTSAFLVYMGVALSITAFPVLARILGELKLLTTSVGRMAMSAAAVNDVAAWILLALAVALSGNSQSPFVSLWVFLSGFSFVVCSILTVLPIFKWMAQQCHEGEPVDELYICATLAAVLAAGFVTDAIGIHAMFGAFVFGILVPKDGPFAGALVEKIEDLVSGLFITPTVFCVKWIEDRLLGFLMNSKGLVELIVLNIGKDRKVLNDQTFAIMVLMALVTTFMTTPLVLAAYKRKARKSDYKYRTIERKNADSQLRILACFHGARNIPSMINLIETSRGIKKHDALRVYAMHLKEFSERSSSILLAQKVRENGLPFWNNGCHGDSVHVTVAFEAYHKLSQVCIRPMIAISSIANIHEDICATAERKRAAIIILPFHKQQRLDGSVDIIRNDFRYVNKRVLEHAPCSVGIFVDRGLGGTCHVPASNVSFCISVFFFGGGDDREALAYAARMAEHPGIQLVVTRFLVEPNIAGEITRVDIEDSSSSNSISEDEEFLAQFKLKAESDDSIVYEEKIVKDAAETVATIRKFNSCNLFLVGIRPSGELACALERSEFPELGPIGGLLASQDCPTTASVLVMQQYPNRVPINFGAEMEEQSPDVDTESS
ncbi:cation/H antiporter [Trifolium repens]|nr:cation/H antiporter [Trifolium repens]